MKISNFLSFKNFIVIKITVNYIGLFINYYSFFSQYKKVTFDLVLNSLHHQLMKVISTRIIQNFISKDLNYHHYFLMKLLSLSTFIFAF